MSYKKKLIEVALPLNSINKASVREKSIRHGHPSTLHLWWARRPLATARAVLFAQLVDDPSSHPELFPTEVEQNAERERLFSIIRELVLWENTNNERVLSAARKEIRKSWALTCKETGEDPEKLPAFHDPFAGGGAIPLEAQRLGLEAWASDLNPVAVMINKAMIEIPPKFAGKPPVNPESRKNDTGLKVWENTQGLAEDVRYYGQWMRDEAEKRIGYLYPKMKVTAEMVKKRPDLAQYEGQELTVIAWIWARTVKSPNPAFDNVGVPLVKSFVLSSKKRKEAWLEPVVDGDQYRFEVRLGKPTPDAKNGTKLGRGANFKCLLSGTPLEPNYIKSEGKSGHIGQCLLAVVCEGNRGRVYLEADKETEKLVASIKPTWKPTGEVPKRLTGGTCYGYGLDEWGKLFTPRQLVALNTLSDLVMETRDQVINSAISAGMSDDGINFSNGGSQATAYGDAIAVYLAFLLSQISNHSSSICGWNSANAQMRSVFSRQAIPMVWDFAECNVFSSSSGSYKNLFDRMIKGMSSFASKVVGRSIQADAMTQTISTDKMVSCDPPYYDNIGYADLSDFFYVWLRRSLRSLFPNIFATMTVPKKDELVAVPYRHGSVEAAEQFFLGGMTEAIKTLSEISNSELPVSIYYAFKQSESSDGNIASTGWEKFLSAVIDAGFSITGTWPFRTEKQGRMIEIGTNALASSILLVCRKRTADVGKTTRRDFQNRLHSELPTALRHLQRGNIAPVDLAQSAIGPGMAIFSEYSKVIEADGTPMKVRTALSLINDVLDEILTEQEGELDSDSRWAVSWFEQYGTGEAPFGTAETLCKAKNTSIEGLVEAGLVYSKSGRVHLLRREELDPNWSPVTDKRLTVWEATQYLIRALEQEGEQTAAALLKQLGGMAEQARDLSYRLYLTSERKGWAEEARSYNALVIAWPELTRLSAGTKAEAPVQTEFI